MTVATDVLRCSLEVSALAARPGIALSCQYRIGRYVMFLL
jgi:hypothetical protein